MADPVKIILGPHILAQAKRRGVPLTPVRSSILKPDLVLEARPNLKTGATRKKHIKKVGTRNVCVVVEYRKQLRIGVTTYWKKQ